MKDDNLFAILVLIALAFFLKSKRRRIADKTVVKLPLPPAPAPVTIKPEPAGNWLAYRELLAKKESSGKYDARRPSSRYWGRYQLGPNARKIGGAKGVKWTDYKKNQSMQDAAVKTWTSRLVSEITAQPTLSAAIGKTLHGQKVTLPLLVAMDHLTGRAAVMRWVRSGKTTTDGNGVVNLTYAKPFAQFDLSELSRKATA